MMERQCTIEDCNRKKVARGWCDLHWRRWRKHGDPLKTLTPSRMIGTPEERFWPKVDAFGDCWEWTAYTCEDGYGIFRAGPKMVKSHRFAWENLVGPIPEGLELDHLCRNRPCVNPDHLELVTHAENMRRTDLTTKWVKRAAALRTHCPNNHSYSGENLIMDNGSRRCRQCKNDGQNRRYQERMKDVERR